MIHTRRAVHADLEQVSELFDQYRMFYGQAADRPAARRFLAERMAHADSVLLVAEAGAGALAGFTQLFPSFSSVAVAPVFVLNDLFVAPDYRRAGVGRALLQAAVCSARGAGALRLSLSTGVNNRPAQALYESLGWIRTTDFHPYTLSITTET